MQPEGLLAAFFIVDIIAARLQKISRKFSHSRLHDDFAPKMVLTPIFSVLVGFLQC